MITGDYFVSWPEEPAEQEARPGPEGRVEPEEPAGPEERAEQEARPGPEEQAEPEVPVEAYPVAALEGRGKTAFWSRSIRISISIALGKTANQLLR